MNVSSRTTKSNSNSDRVSLSGVAPRYDRMSSQK